ncbi:MAG: hypothetical protein WDN06_13940 [Asticcacaulis sp.]
MTSIAIRLAIAAALAACLSGCVIYVAPDHKGWTHHHDSAPAPDEKPADTMPPATT